MSPPSLFRLSGLALMLSAAVFSVAELIAFSILVSHGAQYDLGEMARTGPFLIQSLLTLLSGMLLLGGLVGLYLKQSEAAGRSGFIAFLLAFFGTALVVGDFYTNTFVTPMVAREAPTFLDNPLSGILQVWLPFSFGLLALSWLLLGVVTIRAHVYPRAAGWFLLAAAFVALIPVPITHLPFFVALAWMGLYLLRVRNHAVPRSRRQSKPR